MKSVIVINLPTVSDFMIFNYFSTNTRYPDSLSLFFSPTLQDTGSLSTRARSTHSGSGVGRDQLKESNPQVTWSRGLVAIPGCSAKQGPQI